jgi:hypothetical protein
MNSDWSADVCFEAHDGLKAGHRAMSESVNTGLMHRGKQLIIR